MDKTILIHNPRCSKSREAKALLEEAGIDFEIVDYLKDGLKVKLLSYLPEMLKMPYAKMVRTNEDVYKNLKLAEKNPTQEEWIHILEKYPILLERPIFIHNHKAIIGRPPELVKSIL
ncbi:MAG: arsenate reductase (glutaredoxin) [Bacteriovorax sp.]|jgi:arsenate reductase